jgi:hypothetical protein
VGGTVISHIIILGCGRCGTSIFGELFETVGVHRYYFEPSLEDVRRMNFDLGAVAMKVPKAPIGTPMTPGLPFQLEELLALVPLPRAIFWQVRNPLDAVCSLRPGIEANWSHNPKPPDWEDWLHRPLIERCARHWSYINLNGYRAVRQFSALSRYETLVRNPCTAAIAACALAGCGGTEYEEAILRWAATVSNRKAAPAYEAKRQVVWSRQDHSVRMERWRENLTSDEVAAVREIVAEAAAEVGYAV